MAGWNNMRGMPGEKVIEGLAHCYNLKKISLGNNLLGVAYDDQKEKDHNKKVKEPPVCKMA
jgi:hypothetical protein